MANPNPSPNTRFNPGQSGNPGGRPKKPDIDELNRYIDENGSLAQIADAWVKNALGRPDAPEINVPLFKMLIEYRNGQPSKAQDDEADGPPVPRSIRVEFVDAAERSDPDPVA